MSKLKEIKLKITEISDAFNKVDVLNPRNLNQLAATMEQMIDVFYDTPKLIAVIDSLLKYDNCNCEGLGRMGGSLPCSWCNDVKDIGRILGVTHE